METTEDLKKYRIRDRVKNGIEFTITFGALAYIKLGAETNQFITGNIPDMIYPITNYTLMRATLNMSKPSIGLATVISMIGIGSEIAQKYNLLPQPFVGTYDPKDIVMFTLGGLIAYGIDKLTFKKHDHLEDKLVIN